MNRNISITRIPITVCSNGEYEKTLNDKLMLIHSQFRLMVIVTTAFDSLYTTKEKEYNYLKVKYGAKNSCEIIMSFMRKELR